MRRTDVLSENLMPENEIPVEVATPPVHDNPAVAMPTQTIRRNMASLVLLETTFWTGSADINLALQPLLVYLGASNKMIGWVNGAVFMGLIGVLLSPWITRRFPYKKWYLFVGNVPYLAAIAAMGVLSVYSRELGFTHHTLLLWVFGLYLTHWFFGGFVTLPCTEYIAACIPMSHRGRLTGYAYSAAGGTAIGAALLGKWILQTQPKPASFGLVLLLGWLFCQLGYTSALFAKETRTPVEDSPNPYSREMFKALWRDKPYVKLLILYGLYSTFFYTTTFNFISIYGFKQVKMALWTTAIITIVAQVSKLITSAPMGLLIDRLTPKRTLPYIFFTAAAAWIAPIAVPWIWHLCGDPAVFAPRDLHLLRWVVHIPSFTQNIVEALGVYVGMALGTICVTGLISAQTALICGLPSPENRAGHFTIQVILMYVALTVGPIMLGYLCDWLPYRTVFILMTGISLLFYPLGRIMLRDLPDDLRGYS